MARSSFSRCQNSKSSSGPKLIIGALGQDGTILRREILRAGGSTICLDAGLGPSIFDRPAIRRLIKTRQPDEIYYLAAAHTSAEGRAPEDFRSFESALDTHVQGLWNTLEAVRDLSPRSRLVYAASSRVFGTPSGSRLTEDSPLNPVDVYGLTKSMGMLVSRYFRSRWGVFASNAILFNHESAYRPKSFLSRRIIDGLLAIKNGDSRRLLLADPSARADWILADDAVAAMRLILKLKTPADFIVAGGKTHSVSEFAREAARALGLPASAGRPVRSRTAKNRRGVACSGDSTRLRRASGWRPNFTFAGMIKKICSDMETLGNTK